MNNKWFLLSIITITSIVTILGLKLDEKLFDNHRNYKEYIKIIGISVTCVIIVLFLINIVLPSDRKITKLVGGMYNNDHKITSETGTTFIPDIGEEIMTGVPDF